MCALLLGAASAAAADPHRPIAPQAPQEKIVEANHYPWSLIGKLNNGMGGACTAVLISPRHALTAAHCLYFNRTEKFVPAQSLHLLFGYENQVAAGHYLVSAYYIPPGYDPLRPYETLASDWALLSVAAHRRAAAQPSLAILQDEALTPASTLMTAGYSHYTPYAMTADHHCNLIGRSPNGALLYDSCKAPSGYSGAPVLAANADNSAVSLAGIHVANQVFKTNAVAIAIPIKAIWREIRPCVENGDCRFQYVATGRDPTADELLLPNLASRNRYELSSSAACDEAADAACGASADGMKR
jgi:protease YdgD